MKQEAERDWLECNWKCKAYASEQQISSSLLEMKLWQSVVVGGGGFVKACCRGECRCDGVNVGALPPPFSSWHRRRFSWVRRQRPCLMRRSRSCRWSHVSSYRPWHWFWFWLWLLSHSLWLWFSPWLWRCRCHCHGGCSHWGGRSRP